MNNIPKSEHYIPQREARGQVILPSLTTLKYKDRESLRVKLLNRCLSLLFPPGCSNPDCNFIITVDSGEGINESSELNNTVDNGTCFG